MMKSERMIIGMTGKMIPLMVLSVLVLLLCLSCGSGSDGSGDEPDVPKEQPKLQINIYTPGHPVVTRADVGDVEGEKAEMTIHKLQIWVFEHSNGEKVAYLEDTNPMAQLRDTTGGAFLRGTYQLIVSNKFAEDRPAVDVFVLANGNQTGLQTFGENTTRNVLQSALMEEGCYGLTTFQTSVSETQGLPLSGRLNAAELGGVAPVLYVKNTVTVVRSVSKIRFIFSRNKPDAEDEGKDDLHITKIDLDADMLPNSAYLFLSGQYTPRVYHLPDGIAYNSLKTLAEPVSMTINQCATPAKYAFVSSLTGQEYENLINSGITQNELTQVGRFYFRESDRQMRGTIYYRIEDKTTNHVDDRKATFKMNSAGDFSRNHTWIVYGYFAGSDNLQITSVKITPWEEVPGDNSHEVYNW